MRTRVVAVALAVGLTLVAGCGTGSAGGTGERTLTVLAAASLTGGFTELAGRFEAEHDGVEVRTSFAGSSDLAQQIVNGAPADVFAAADLATMDTVVAAGTAAGQPAVFATNTPQIVVPAGNPDRIRSLADLTRPGLVVVVCAPPVPCGAAAVAAQRAAGVTLRPASEEPDVRSVLGKVVAGEADAGVVFRTEVLAAGDAVTGVQIPEAAAVVNEYPIVRVRDGAAPTLAKQFVELVLGATGQRVLADAGFGPPP